VRWAERSIKKDRKKAGGPKGQKRGKKESKRGLGARITFEEGAKTRPNRLIKGGRVTGTWEKK